MANRQLQPMETALSLGNIDSYIHWVKQIPILTQDEEQKLAEQFRDHGDLNAARQLVISQLRFVVRIARGYAGYGLPQADLIQEGNIGLMKAVKRFDPSMGNRLVTFAVHWIKAEIHEFVLRNWRIVKVATTKAQRKLFFNLRKATKKLGWLSKSEVDNIAHDLNVKSTDVLTMESRLNNRDEAFDGTDNSEDDWHAPVNYLTDISCDPATLIEHQDSTETNETNLVSALTQLDERSRDILQQRWLNDDNKATLHELADKYDISAERVRQLEKQAMEQLKKSIQTH